MDRWFNEDKKFGQATFSESKIRRSDIAPASSATGRSSTDNVTAGGRSARIFQSIPSGAGQQSSVRQQCLPSITQHRSSAQDRKLHPL